MGIFDFLKKKEFQKIEELKKQLEKYEPISNIEIEIENQKKNLQHIISAKVKFSKKH